MDCKKMEELIITDYMDGRLESAALEKAESHIASCSRCRKLVEDLRSIRAVFKGARIEEPPFSVWQGVREEISGIHKKKVSMDLAHGFFALARPFFAHFKPAIAIATTAVLILVILTAIRLLPFGGQTVIPIDQDDILSITMAEGNGNDKEYDFNTAAEEYFL